MRHLIKDAYLALETLDICAERPGSVPHAISSAEWLEQLACEIREELKKKPEVAEVAE